MEVKLEDAPHSAKPFYDKGMHALERKNLGYAMDMFETVLTIEPRLLDVRQKLRSAAVAHTKTNPPGKLAFAKQMPTFMKAAGALKKNPMLAIELTEKILKTDPFNSKVCKLQCDAAKMAELPEIAILTLETLSINGTADLSELSQLASLYQNTDQYDLEYECREKIVKLKPNDGKASKELKDAAARLTMGKTGWQKAEARQQAQQEPRTPLEKADQMIRERNYDEAIQKLETMQKEKPHDPTIGKKLYLAREHQLNAKLAHAEDEEDEATVSILRRELAGMKIGYAKWEAERYPNDLQLKFELGKLYFNAGQLTEAIQQFQFAKENPQRSVRSMIYLGKAFALKGQTNIAADQFEEALEHLASMDETRKEVLYELGLLLQKQGDTEKALVLLKEIYAVDIGYRDVAVRIEKPA